MICLRDILSHPLSILVDRPRGAYTYFSVDNEDWYGIGTEFAELLLLVVVLLLLLLLLSFLLPPFLGVGVFFGVLPMNNPSVSGTTSGHSPTAAAAAGSAEGVEPDVFTFHPGGNVIRRRPNTDTTEEF
jgi:hypothetical protein